MKKGSEVSSPTIGILMSITQDYYEIFSIRGDKFKNFEEQGEYLLFLVK